MRGLRDVYLPPLPRSVYTLQAGGLLNAFGNGLVIPFMLIYNQELMLIGEPVRIVKAFVTALIGSLSLAFAAQGWLFGPAGAWQRISLFAAGLLLIVSEPVTDLVGAALFAVPFLVQRRSMQARDRVG